MNEECPEGKQHRCHPECEALRRLDASRFEDLACPTAPVPCGNSGRGEAMFADLPAFPDRMRIENAGDLSPAKARQSPSPSLPIPSHANTTSVLDRGPVRARVGCSVQLPAPYSERFQVAPGERESYHHAISDTDSQTRVAGVSLRGWLIQFHEWIVG